MTHCISFRFPHLSAGITVVAPLEAMIFTRLPKRLWGHVRAEVSTMDYTGVEQWHPYWNKLQREDSLDTHYVMGKLSTQLAWNIDNSYHANITW